MHVRFSLIDVLGNNIVLFILAYVSEISNELCEIKKLINISILISFVLFILIRNPSNLLLQSDICH